MNAQIQSGRGVGKTGIMWAALAVIAGLYASVGTSRAADSVEGAKAGPADHFDFGGMQMVERDFVPVGPATVFAADRGYGWLDATGLSVRDQGRLDALRRDFIAGSKPATFRVTGLQPGLYELTVVSGDLLAGNHVTRVKVAGAEGDLPSLSPEPGQAITLRATVKVDRSLDITFDSPRNNWVVNGLWLARADAPHEAQVSREALSRSTPEEGRTHTLVFDTQSPGEKLHLTQWGLDTAWAEPDHMKRGLLYMTPEHVNIVRVSFPVNEALVNGDLPSSKDEHFRSRLEIAKLAGDKPFTLLPDTEGGVNAWYKNGREVIPERWVQLIAAAQKRYGKKMASIEAFNEADWGWGQGSIGNLNDILALMQKRPEFSGVQLSGPSTLSDDAADAWYQPIKNRISRGTTHSLGGNFYNYINFYVNVSANGQVADQPEAHNLVEVISGAEYGLQSAIWWGTAELSRGEFVKAVHGDRLAYAEDRLRWSSAGVYRAPDGKVQAFLGSSERSGQTTTFRFVSRDRDVFFNGDGPRRDISWTILKDTEAHLNITWGADVPPTIGGNYIIVNRQTGKALGVANADTARGAPVTTEDYAKNRSQQWEIAPHVGRWGDQNYVTLRAAHSGKVLSVSEKSYEDGAAATQRGDGDLVSGQWYLEYAGDNCFNIRNRWSTQFLDGSGEFVHQALHGGGTAQQWRLIPVADHPIDLVAPHAPAKPVATGKAASVELKWEASSDNDVASYTILRSTRAGGPYETIARDVKGNAFVDGTAGESNTYYYIVKAVDYSLNSSPVSAEVSGRPTGGPTLVAGYEFTGDGKDASGNGHDARVESSVKFGVGVGGHGALILDGEKDFARLPVGLVDSPELTLATWVFPQAGAQWQRIFDLGNDESQYFFLTPASSENTLRLAAKNGGAEITLDGHGLRENAWSHVALTLSGKTARLYVNGQQVASSDNWTVKPADFKPIFNYLGQSQFPADPTFHGRLSDVRVYNYALPADEIAKLGAGAEPELKR